MAVALTTHAFGTTNPGSTTGATATLPSFSTDDIIVALFTGRNQSGVDPHVSSVTGGGLTWHKRFEFNVTYGGVDHAVYSLWYARATSGGTNMAINATYDQNIARNLCTVFGASGTFASSPWDSNASLNTASANSYTSGTNTSTHNVTYSTSNSNDMIIAVLADDTGNGGPSGGPDSGFTMIEDNAGGTMGAYLEYKVVSSKQNSVTQNVISALNDNSWYAFVDALTADGPPRPKRQITTNVR